MFFYFPYFFFVWTERFEWNWNKNKISVRKRENLSHVYIIYQYLGNAIGVCMCGSWHELNGKK